MEMRWCNTTLVEFSDLEPDLYVDLFAYFVRVIPQQVICTSAVPMISKLSIVKAFLKIPFNLIRGKKSISPGSLKFKWKAGQYPEKVDYLGQMAQIDMAKKIGVEHVVIVSSMGGTDPNNFLNSIGKDQDGRGNGDILLWKRKAEKYLIEVSFIPSCSLDVL